MVQVIFHCLHVLFTDLIITRHLVGITLHVVASGRLVISISNTLTMDPSQFDALTRQLAQLATSLSTVQSDITATREERKNLAAKLSNFKRTPRLTDTNSEASHNRQYHVDKVIKNIFDAIVGIGIRFVSENEIILKFLLNGMPLNKEIN